VIEDVLVGREDTVGEPVVPHELPDVFNWVQLWALGRQRDDGDVPWDAPQKEGSGGRHGLTQIPSRWRDQQGHGHCHPGRHRLEGRTSEDFVHVERSQPGPCAVFVLLVVFTATNAASSFEYAISENG
jgi:hypothetical protein